MISSAPKRHLKSNSSDTYSKRWSEKKVFAIFQKPLSRSNFSTTAKNIDDKPSMLNPRREVQGQIIVCKTPLHTVSMNL